MSLTPKVSLKNGKTKSVHLETEMWTEIKRLASGNGCSQSEVVRAAIQEYLARQPAEVSAA